MRLYNYLKPKVVAELSESISKIHISFDGWITKGGKRGYLGIVAHYVDSSGELKDLHIALPQLAGAHSGEAMAEIVIAIFKEFNIDVGSLGYFVLDNAYNNNTTINTIASKMGFNATEKALPAALTRTISLAKYSSLAGTKSRTITLQARLQ